MLDLVPTYPELLFYLGKLLHIVAVVLKSQLVSLWVTANAEVPSTFGHEFEWLSCNARFAQRLVFYPVLHFAADFNLNAFVAWPYL